MKDLIINSLSNRFDNYLLKSGIDFSYNKKLLGHKSSKTVEI